MNGTKMIDDVSKEDFNQLLQSTGKAVEMYEEASTAVIRCKNESEKRFLILAQNALKEEIISAFADLLDMLTEKDKAFEKIGIKMKESLQSGICNGISGVKAFYNMLCTYVDDESSNEAFLDEVMVILSNGEETGVSTIEDNPFLKALVRRNAKKVETTEKITVANQDDLTIKSGRIEVYEKEVLDTVLKPYREGRVTSDGTVVFTLGQGCRWMNGSTGTPSKKQIEDYKAALLSLRNKPFNYETSAQLADIIGTEAANIVQGIGGIKGGSSKTVEEHIIDRCDFITEGYTVRGQPAMIALVKWGNLFKRLVDSFPWYEEISDDVKQVKYMKNGVLTKWAYTKQRTAIRTYIFSEVHSKIRANANGVYYSGKLPYCKVFTTCGIDVGHTQKMSNRRKDVQIVFEHLQRCGIVTAFHEYRNKGSKTADGIEYRIGKATLEVEGGVM